MATNDKLKRLMAILIMTTILVASVTGCGNKAGAEKDGNLGPGEVSSVQYEKVITRNSEVTAPAAKELNNHNLVAENNNYALYMKEDVLSIIVYDKHTGKYMESSPSYDDGKCNATWKGAMSSAVVLTMISGSIDTQQADLLNGKVNKEIKYTDNGFVAELYWTKYMLGMTLEVSLTEDGIVARVPDESIKEDGSKYYIGTISVYPYMGSTYMEDKEGYMFIPDGNGALIYLDDKDGRFSSGYSSSIYGSDAGFVDSKVVELLWGKYEIINDSNRILAPVYGMAYTDDDIAYLAIIEEGEERAIIEASPNGASIDYNRIYAKIVSRKLYTQPTSNSESTGSFKMIEADRSHSDIQIRFVFLSEDDADYCGMANAYRDYLFENGSLAASEDSFRTRIDFLGTDRESWVVGTKAIVMTTIDDIKGIYDELKTEGVTDVLSVYKGWQNGGLYNLPITKYKADKEIGGTKALSALIKESEESGIKLYLYNDALRINPDENNATFNTIKRVNKTKFEEETYKDVYEKFMYLTPARTDKLTDKFVSDYTENGVYNIALAGISNSIFSYSYSGKFYTRHDCAASYANLISRMDEKINLVLEQPLAYLWKNTEAFLDMPLYTSSYIYEDESVPFLSIVLKGVIPVYSEYVNFEANKQEFFLKLVETGTYPSFYITKEASSDLIYTNSSDIYSSQYSIYRDMIVEYASELRTVNEKVKGSYITGHEIREGGLTVVTYNNGVKIYLNYGEADITADGYTILGMSYKVVE